MDWLNCRCTYNIIFLNFIIMSFMEQKYCRPSEDFKWPAPFFGAALCCEGVPPAVDFDDSDPNSAYRVGHIRCPKCGNQVGVFANGGSNLLENVGFLYKNWNRCFQPCKVNSGTLLEPTLALPQGKEGQYRWGECNIDYDFIGGKQGKSIHFVLFKTAHSDVLGKKAGKECWIDDERCLKDLSILDKSGNEVNLTWLLEKRNVHVHVSASWSTDGTSWYCLNIRFYNTARKHILKFEQEMNKAGFSVSLL